MSGMQMEDRGPVGGTGDYMKDGTVDLKGMLEAPKGIPILRSSTGKWKACYFIVFLDDTPYWRTHRRHLSWSILDFINYLMGMVLLTFVVSLSALHPPSCGNGVRAKL
ncbi:hypothetical protein AAHA92_09958 [Salvia divinorum]|uniref:Uncharacterized protein n=1 Tax=Salvia divinorum TaxID=28513 RepID=A0ABD1HT22_SALDI